MGEVYITKLPEKLKMRCNDYDSDEPFSIDVSSDAITIVGFINMAFRQSHRQGRAWPRPLLQMDGDPIVTHEWPTRFYGHEYNQLMHTISSHIVREDKILLAAFSSDGRGRVVPESYEVSLISELDSGNISHFNPDTYLLRDGPIRYSQPTFDDAVRDSKKFYDITHAF